MLLDALQDFNTTFNEAIKCGEFSRFNIHNIEFFFYLVLDNASNVLVHERQKKIVTKLCVAQSLLSQ